VVAARCCKGSVSPSLGVTGESISKLYPLVTTGGRGQGMGGNQPLRTHIAGKIERTRRCASLLICILLVWIVTGCAALGGPTSTPDPLSGTVTLTTPPEGAVIYASALYVAGTLADVPSKSLLIRLRTPENEIIAESRVDAVQGDWSTEIVHGYTGAPNPVTVEVVPLDAPSAEPFARSQIFFAALEDRPDGMFVTLITPEDGREIGGDDVLVSGTASGIPDRTFNVSLTNSNGQVLDTQTVTLSGRYDIDEYPWEVTLQTQANEGNAVIRITTADGEELAAISVIMSSAAG
jgi:hypothetical protein